MDQREVHRLLVQVAAIDGRIVTDMLIAAWADTRGINRVPLEDAIEALNAHRAEKPGVWVEPGHIIAGARKIRAERERQANRQLAIEPRVITKPPPEIWRRMVQEAIEQNRRTP